VTQPSGSNLQALAWEALLTFFLMLVITAVATDTRAVGEAAALAIGGTVALGALVGGPISGASMNPARSLGPALVAGDLTAIWIYLVGPILGAIAAAFAYRYLRGEPDSTTDPPDDRMPAQ
jgi:aquaporin NIP